MRYSAVFFYMLTILQYYKQTLLHVEMFHLLSKTWQEYSHFSESQFASGEMNCQLGIDLSIPNHLVTSEININICYTKGVIFVYITKQIQIHKGHKMYQYFDDLCHNANNLYNVTCYYIRQYATALQSFEEMKPLHQNQMEIYNYVQWLTKGTKYYPAGKWLNFYTVDYLLKTLDDPDYYGLPSQVNQQVIKMALADFKSYFESIKIWKVNPTAFTGMPKMPYYKKSGSSTTVKLTNQVCTLKKRKLKFPNTKLTLKTPQIGDSVLKEIRVKPHHIGFTIDIVLEEPIEGEIIVNENHNDELLTKYKDYTTLNERALAIDIGLSNLCAVVNNFGETPFLIKGTSLKSINQLYNKRLAYYQSIAKTVNGLHYTNRMYRLTRKRNNQIKDYMHKTTTYIANYAKEHDVNIVVIGHNKLQKQEINIGHVNNQNFVQIPTTVLITQLQYKLNRLGIELVIVEESYTSKASFENLDTLPKYGENIETVVFSGKRIHRGLYKTTGKRPINADINGAANILRKAFPNVREWDSGVVDTPVVKLVA